jgi:hypothetical protein
LASWGACEALAVAFEEQGSDGLLKILPVIELHLSADGVGEGKIEVGSWETNQSGAHSRAWQSVPTHSE